MIRTMGAWLLALCACFGAAEAQIRPAIVSTGMEKPGSAIWIGNSFFFYNNGITGHFARFAEAPLRQTMITISGSGYDWHDVESYFRPNAVGRYSFDPQNNVVFNKPGARLFDLAIMMDCSQCPIHPDLKGIFVDFSKRHAETARKHGATPLLFMSWAYEDKPEMTEQLAEAYVKAGNDNQMMVIPAGLAFAAARKGKPDIKLYIADKRHPTLAGTYLAAATSYAAIYKKSPVGSSYDPGLEPGLAAYLQQVAWDTVRDFYKLNVN